MALPAAHRSTEQNLVPGRGAEILGQSKTFFRALNRPLSVGGCILLFGALIAQLLPPSIRSSNVFNGMLAGFLGLFSLIGFLFLRTKFRISFPAFVLGLIQIWIVATVFLAPQVFGLELKLGRNIWWPSFVLMPYLAAFVLVAIDPRWRQRLLNFMLGVCVFTAFVALLQFVRFPGVYALSQIYVDLDGLKELGLDKRSHGLSTHPFHLAAQCILGCGIVASNLLFRKLTVWEISFYAILSSGLIVAQARTFYIVWVVVTLITLALMFNRNVPQFVVVVCIMGTIIGSVIAAFPEQLSYGLSGKNTISQGRMAQWMRADELSNQFPISGIGPKETVFGSGKDLTGGGRWWTLYTESGYRMSRVSGGFIGLALLILLMASTIYLAARVAFDTAIDEARRRAAFAGFYFAISLAIGLYITNIVENELMTYYGMALAGVVAPQMHELFRSKRGRANLYISRMARANARMKLAAREKELANSSS